MSRRMRLPRFAPTGNPPLDNILAHRRDNPVIFMPPENRQRWLLNMLIIGDAPRKRKKAFKRATRAYHKAVRNDPAMIRLWTERFYESIQIARAEQEGRP